MRPSGDETGPAVDVLDVDPAGRAIDEPDLAEESHVATGVGPDPVRREDDVGEDRGGVGLAVTLLHVEADLQIEAGPPVLELGEDLPDQRLSA